MYGYPTIFATFSFQNKNVLDPNASYISTSETKMRNVCLSVILEHCLLLSSSLPSVARLQPTPGYVDSWNIYLKYRTPTQSVRKAFVFVKKFACVRNISKTTYRIFMKFILWVGHQMIELYVVIWNYSITRVVRHHQKSPFWNRIAIYFLLLFRL